MLDKNVVSSLGEGEYRITFSQAIRLTANLLGLVGTHHVRVVSPRASEHLAIGVEGKKDDLLNWLRSLEMIDPAAIKTYDEMMTD